MAREAGDTGTLWELNQKVEQEFDAHSFRTGLDLLLKRTGAKWTREHWATFGTSGIGVGGYDAYMQTAFLELFGFRADKRIEGHEFFDQGIDRIFPRLLEDTVPLKDGTPVASLTSKGAVHVNTEVFRIDEYDERGNARPTVHFRNTKTKEEWTKSFDRVAFTGGPFEGERRGFLDLATPEIANAAAHAQGEPATTLGFTVPADEFEQMGLPENFQLSNATQQAFVMPRTPGSDVRKVLVYMLGENANKTAEMTDREVLSMFLSSLRAPQARGDGITGEPAVKQRLTDAAAVFERSTKNQHLAFLQWAKGPHIRTAFKMDRAGHRNNSGDLETSLKSIKKNVIFGNEMFVRQGGFISGAVQAGITMACTVAKSLGGTLAPNSPFEHTVPYQGHAR